MKIIKYKKRDYHTYYKNEYGDIDDFYFSVGYHNGPQCERCGYSFCESCKPNGYEDTDCKIPDEHYCEKCNKRVLKDGNFCPNCGNDLRLEIIVEESDD